VTSLSMTELVAMAEPLRDEDLATADTKDLEATLRTFLADQPLLGFELPGGIWFRGRISPPEGFRNLRECIHPPAERTGYNRCNYPNQPVLYASGNPATVLSELDPKPGQFVHLISVRPLKGIEKTPWHVVGEINHAYFAGRSQLRAEKLHRGIARIFDDLERGSPEEMARVIFRDSFLAERFSRRVNRETPQEYKVTAAYANIFWKGNGGMIFPRVQARGGINLGVEARVFDDSFEVVSTHIVEIKASYGWGVYLPSWRRETWEAEADGTILWESTKRPKNPIWYEIGYIPDDTLKGWRVPT
jgi:hypothetical protein